MNISQFKLERYFAQHEFQAKYVLGASDCESLSLRELLALADAKTLQLWEQLSLGYTDTQGHPLLRREICKLYTDISAGEVLVVTPEEGILVTLSSILAPGDEVIVLAPAYQSLYEVARWLGAKVTGWPLRAEGDGWQLDIDFLKRNITHKTKLLVINFPHNPTGYTASKNQLVEILDIARGHKLYVFSDEMYWQLEYDAEQRLPAVCELYEKGVSLFGLSKTFSLPGLRIGWLVTRNKEIFHGLRKLKDYTTICSSAASEILAIAALRAKEIIRNRNLAIIRENLGGADEFFRKYRNLFEWLRPQAGAVAFPRLKGAIPIERFCEGLREEKSVLLVPGSLFDYPGSHFRLGLGRKNFGAGLKKLEEYVDERRINK